MVWVRLDDGFFDNPKAIRAGRDGRCLALAALCWSASQLSDGLVPKEAVPALAMKAGVPKAAARKLVEVGMWHDCGDHYEIHDFGEYNPTADKVKAERLAAKARMKKIRSGEHAANGSRTSQATSRHPVPSVPSEPLRRPLRSVEPQPPSPPYHKTFDPDAPQCIPCDGTGRNTDTGARCLTCGGTGKPQEATA
jgi:hypothetical protein